MPGEKLDDQWEKWEHKLWDFEQGWGHVNLKPFVSDLGSFVMKFIDGKGLNTAEIKDYKFEVNDSNYPFLVTLVYTDYPGNGLINNLNLIVTMPDGKTTYHGNQFSEPYDSEFDAVNNVEKVFIKEPEPGEYTVTVLADNVSEGPQDFSLAVSGGMGEVKIIDCAEGLIKLLHNGQVTCKAVDVCGTQAFAEDAEFDIDEKSYLKFALKAEKDTDTCLLLMLYDKERNNHVSRYVVVGKTPKYQGFYDIGEECLEIKDDNQWHDNYNYNLKNLKIKYPNAKYIRMIQFYSFKECDATPHTFYIKKMIFE